MARAGDWDELRARVHADPGLAAELAAIEPDRFADELVRRAAALGLTVDAASVEAEIAAGVRRWTARWLR